MFRIDIILFCLLCATHVSAGNFNLEQDLVRLDSVVSNYKTYIAAKEKEIATYRHNSGLLVAASDKYLYNRQLFELYLKFNSDSAVCYAEKCVAIASRKGMEAEYTMSRIDLAMAYAFRGDMIEAQELLAQIGDIELLEEPLRTKMAIAMLETKIRRNYQPQQRRSKDYRRLIDRIWVEYGRYLKPENWMNDYYKSLITERVDLPKVMSIVKKTPKPSVQAAMLYQVVALGYRNKGDEKGDYHYLILSAINDIKSANREAMSLVQIINSPFIDKGSKRAVKYAMLCADNARIYNDKWRSLDIVTAHSIITQQYERKLEKQESTMKITIVLLVVAIVAICLLYYLVLRKRRKAIELIAKIRMMNQTLRDMVEREKQMQTMLKENNDRLEAEIQMRNTNFINVYQLVSKYIQEEKDFRKRVFNQITSGKIDKARSALASTSETEKYKHGFYQQFDQAFLTSHPDFIDKFNALLKPDCQVSLTETGELTPELRIYALVSIGITDSVSIASFLHYSPQTVYNYRLKMRHNACISEKTFADTVARFYAKADI
ncbi:MAG: DUF6377 domain-containing protein [Prevotella sp.]